VKSESGDLVKHCINDPILKSASGVLLTYAFTTNHLRSKMEWLMKKASVKMVNRPDFMQKMNDLCAKSMLRDDVYSELIRSMVTDNIVSTKWLVSKSSEAQGEEAVRIREKLDDWRTSTLDSL
jgi:hypothetical protein